MKITVTAGLAVAAMLVSGAVAGAPAQAAGQDGSADPGEFVFYYNSNKEGSFSDFANSKSDLASYKFLSIGTGINQYVKNNAASVRNLDASRDARVYYNSNYMGASDLITAGHWANLANTYNENASFQWVS